MHKTIVMSKLSLQEWRPHICSQTERISKLVLEFSSPRIGSSVPFSEMAISRQTSTHWERSPPCALIHFACSGISAVGKELMEFNSSFPLVVLNNGVDRDETETR